MLFDLLLSKLETGLRASFNTCVKDKVVTARTELEAALAEVAEERAMGLAEVARERAELHREIEAMYKHKEAHEGHIELNVGGYRFETSVQTLRRIPHTFFDAYFSGRYAQDVCSNGSIFVDRDGKHFGHVLEYMRDGVVAVAETGACPSLSLLRELKREFGFYCIELCAEQSAQSHKPEMAYVMGGHHIDFYNDDDDYYDNATYSSMERYDAASGQWIEVAAMSIDRYCFGACAVAGDMYVTGGICMDESLATVEKYSPSTDSWSAVAPLPSPRWHHTAVAVGSIMYVFGGQDFGRPVSTLKFDTRDGTWSEIAPMPNAHRILAACAVGTDIFVFDGCSVVFKYDTETDDWSNVCAMSESCSQGGAALLHGLIYLVGGDDGVGVNRFDPITYKWSTAAPTLEYRSGASTFVLGTHLYAVGEGIYSGSMERYDCVTKKWTVVEGMIQGRLGFGAVTTTIAGPVEEQDLFDSLIAQAGGHA